MKYYIDALKKYANFNGRARRKEYWMFILFYIIFAVCAAGLDFALGLPAVFLNNILFGDANSKHQLCRSSFA